MKARMTLVSVLLAIGLCIPTFASATITTLGNPFAIGSWAQAFQETGVGNFNFMEAFMISNGDAFEALGFVNFSAGGWSGSLVRADYIKAQGSDLNLMQFDIKFAGFQSDPLIFDFLAWNGTTLLEAARAVWDGSNWSFAAAPAGENYDRTAVPEPTTLMLLGVGLIGLAVSRKKLTK
jgi:hypothetical protein